MSSFLLKEFAAAMTLSQPEFEPKDLICAVLSLIPRFDSFHFKPLLLIDKNGQNFKLSIQGSKFHCSSPQQVLPQVTSYNSVELAVFLDEQWGKPSLLGFTRVLDNEFDDVQAYVLLDDLVADLEDFFNDGGLINATGCDWLQLDKNKSLT